MKKNKISLNELIKKLRLLEEGTYTKDNLDVIVIDEIKSKNHKTCFFVNIIKGETTINFYIPFINDYSINIENPTNDFKLFISKTFHNIPYISSSIAVNGKEYNLRNKYISDQKNNSYTINNTELIKEINKECKIAYNYDDNQVYIYYKKYDVKEDELNNYIKFKYDDKFIKNRDLYNSKISKIKETLKDEIYNREFRVLIDSLYIPKIIDNLKDEVTTIIKVANIYKENSNKLDFEKTELFKEIYDFTEYLINNPTEAKINNLKNEINKLDLTNKNEMKKLKKMLKDISNSKELDNQKESLEAKKHLLTLTMTDIDN